MPNIITQNVTWVPRGIRGHGSAYQPFGPNIPNGNVNAGSLPVQVPMGETLPYTDAEGNPENLILAFLCVTNTADGNHVFFPGQTGTVTVGSADITFTYIFVPQGYGGQPGDGGVSIDAFDVNAGAFADDPYFVNVVTDASLNDEANLQGWVPSTAAEDVQAFNAIHGVPFEQWLMVMGNDTINQEDVFIPEDGYGVCFAFFKTPVNNGGGYKPNFKDIYEAIYVWVSKGVMVDGGGPTGGGPVPPWNPDVLELIASLSLASTASRFSSKTHAQVMQTAARQVMASAERIAGAINAHANIHKEFKEEFSN